MTIADNLFIIHICFLIIGLILVILILSAITYLWLIRWQRSQINKILVKIEIIFKIPLWPRIQRLISISEHYNYETQLLNILAVYEADNQRFAIYNKDLIEFLSGSKKGWIPIARLKEFVNHINEHHQKKIDLFKKTNHLLANDDNQRLFYFMLTVAYQKLLNNYLLFTQNNYLNQKHLQNVVNKTEKTFKILHFKLLEGEPKIVNTTLSQLHYLIITLMGINDVIPFITTLLDDYIPDKLRILGVNANSDDYNAIHENIMQEVITVKKNLYALKYHQAADHMNKVLKKIYYYMHLHQQPFLTDEKQDQFQKIWNKLLVINNQFNYWHELFVDIIRKLKREGLMFDNDINVFLENNTRRQELDLILAQIIKEYPEARNDKLRFEKINLFLDAVFEYLYFCKQLFNKIRSTLTDRNNPWGMLWQYRQLIEKCWDWLQQPIFFHFSGLLINSLQNFRKQIQHDLATIQKDELYMKMSALVDRYHDPVLKITFNVQTHLLMTLIAHDATKYCRKYLIRSRIDHKEVENELLQIDALYQNGQSQKVVERLWKIIAHEENIKQ